MSNYIATIEVKHKEDYLDKVVRRVTDVKGKDVALYRCKFYEVKVDFKRGHGLYINLREQVRF